MDISEMRLAIDRAERELKNADFLTEDLVALVVGRLRNLKTYRGQRMLKSLKAELKAFDSRSGVWKESK